MPEPTYEPIEKKYGTKYQHILERQLQQDDSEFERYCRVLPAVVGRQFDIPFTDKAVMKRIKSAYQKIENPQHQKFTNLVMFPVPYYGAYEFTLDSRLYNNNLDATTASITTEIRAEANRKKDEVILGVHFDEQKGCFVENRLQAAPDDPYDDEKQPGGLFGSAHMGVNGQHVVDIDPVKQTVEVDFVNSGTKIASNLGFHKITKAISMLRKARALVTGRTTGIIVMSESQHENLLNQQEVMSADYANVCTMREGHISRIFGCEVRVTENLPYDEDGNRVCAVYVKEHLLFAPWKGLDLRIDSQVQEGVNYGQVVAQMSYGAVRKYQNSVVRILCNED